MYIKYTTHYTFCIETRPELHVWTCVTCT